MSTYTITVNDPNAPADAVLDISGVGPFHNGKPTVVELTDEQVNGVLGSIDEETGDLVLASNDLVKITKGGSLPTQQEEAAPAQPEAPTGGEG